MTLASDFALSTSSAYVTIMDSLMLTNGARVLLTGASTYTYFRNSPLISGNGEIVLAATNSTLYPWTTNTTVTFGAGVTVRGVGTVYLDYQTGSTFVNQGTIRANVPGQTLQLRGNAWQNQGTIEAVNGGIAQLYGNAWTNQGMLGASGGSTLTLGSTGTTWSNAHDRLDQRPSTCGTLSLSALGIFQRTGGSVNLVGTLSNTPMLTLDATTGSWNARRFRARRRSSTRAVTAWSRRLPAR